MPEGIEPNLEDYFDLTEGATLDGFIIQPTGFECEIRGPDSKRYKGFLLAKSNAGNAYTLVDVDFQYSKTDKRYAARPTFRRTNKNLEDKPINKGYRFQRISFADGQDGYRQFWQVIGFLASFKETVDLGSEFRGFKAVSTDSIVSQLMEKNIDERKQAIIDYVVESNLTLEDMAGALVYKSRSDDLIEFKRLIEDTDGYRTEYRVTYSVKKPGDEALFHHFLKSHRWIFGLSLDLRFTADFADEASVGVSDTNNKGDPQTDMLGWNDFTVTIELKTPDAKFFTPMKMATARTNTWSFTSDFIDSYSQALAQKDDWTKSHTNKDIIQDADGVKKTVDQRLIRTVDPKAILVYGNKEKEIPTDSELKDIQTKRDTLERYIRDHKNVSIISYDELYLRAYHIVHGKAPDDDFDW